MSAPRQLAQTAARGAALLAAVAVVSRVSTFAGQLVLGHYLLPEQFGLYGTALGFTSFAAVLAQAGLRETLVQRSRRLAFWAPLATRLAVGIALAGWILLSAMALAVPWSPAHEPLRWMLPLLGAVWPLTAAGLVPEVQLLARLDFRRTSRIAISSQLLTVALQVLLGWLGAQVFALVVPYLASAGVRALLFRLAAGPVPRRRRAAGTRHAALLLGRSRWAMLVTLLGMVWAYGDYVLLGLRFSPEQVGQYFFAFGLSTASMMLLTQNVSQVLFPTLLHLKGDPAAQWRASRRALGLLGLLGVPFCAAQVLVGVPLLQLVYGAKWATAEWIFAALSVGMAFRVVGSPAGAVMQAQGRFRYQAKVMAQLAALFLVLVGAGLATGSLAATVALLALFYVVVGPFNIWAAGRPHGATVLDALAIFVRPGLLTLLAIAAALVPEHVLDLHGAGVVIARALAFSAAWLACVLAFDRARLVELLQRLFRRTPLPAPAAQA